MALQMGLKKRIHTMLRDPLKVFLGVLSEAWRRRDMDENTEDGQDQTAVTFLNWKELWRDLQ